MDIEKLNKSQIILLTLLTSFVTSIATGIVTVTLMAQAPPGMTHTISKVVEKTIETVVPEKTQNTTVVKTVVVEQEDALADAVDKNKQGMVTVRKVSEVTEGDVQENKEDFVSIGFVATDDGLVVVDSERVADNTNYLVELNDGTIVPMIAVKQDETRGIAILAVKKIDESVVFSPVKFTDEESLKLGEGVAAMGGADTVSISTGIITGLLMSEREISNENSEEPILEKYLDTIQTSIELDQKDSGAILFDMTGRIIGMNILRNGKGMAIPASAVGNFITTYAETTTNTKATAKETI